MLVLCQHMQYMAYMLMTIEPKREQGRVFQMRVSDAFLATIDDWRREQSDIPSRAEAIRTLIQRGLGTSSQQSEQPAEPKK